MAREVEAEHLVPGIAPGFAGGGAACRALVQKLRGSTELKDWVARFPTLEISAQW